MAIDAVIVNVKEDKTNGDLILILGSRVYKNGVGKISVSIKGRHTLRVKNYTYMPKVGQFIWGGADTARLVDNVPNSRRQEYHRTITGALIEAAAPSREDGAT